MINRLTALDAYYCKIDKKLYFFSREINGLFRIDLKLNKTEFLLYVDEYNIDEKNLYGSVASIDDDLIVFSPLAANDLLIYNINTNSYQLVPIKKRTDYVGQDYKFFSIYVDHKTIYLFPAHYPAILEYNIDTNATVYYTDWIEQVKEFVTDGGDFFRQSVCYRDNMLYVPFCTGDYVLLFNLNKKKMIIKKINTSRIINQGFSGICDDGNNFWLSSMYGDSFYKWNIKDDIIDCFKVENVNMPSDYSYVGCFFSNDRFFLRPAIKNSFYFLDVNTCKINKKNIKDINKNIKADEGASSLIFLIKDVNNGKLFMSMKDGSCYIIDNDSNMVINQVNISYNEAINEWSQIKGKMIYEFIVEDENWDLKMFIDNTVK